MENSVLQDKRVLVTGGTGSLGKALLKRIMTKEFGQPKKVIVFSRDEAKQHMLRLEFKNLVNATDETIYKNFEETLEFRIGDVRDFHSFSRVLRDADIVINTAALKQVPTCEYFPFEAVQTNILGAENIVRAINELNLNIETVVGVSTDKACKPVNVMGMTKSLQERVLIAANIYCKQTRFICVRYGNVLASRGSVIPLFHYQIKNKGPVTITTQDMTRFLLSLDSAVDTVMFAIAKAGKGETIIPNIPSSRVKDIAEILIGDRKIEIKETGIRPGEKIHEIMVSEEEAWRTYSLSDKYYAIAPMLPELTDFKAINNSLTKEFSSEDSVMTKQELETLLRKNNLLMDQNADFQSEFLLK